MIRMTNLSGFGGGGKGPIEVKSSDAEWNAANLQNYTFTLDGSGGLSVLCVANYHLSSLASNPTSVTVGGTSCTLIYSDGAESNNATKFTWWVIDEPVGTGTSVVVNHSATHSGCCCGVWGIDNNTTEVSDSESQTTGTTINWTVPDPSVILLAGRTFVTDNGVWTGDITSSTGSGSISSHFINFAYINGAGGTSYTSTFTGSTDNHNGIVVI